MADDAAAEDDEVEIVEESEADRAARLLAAAKESVPVNLRVVTQSGEELSFKLKSNTKLGKLMEAFCKRKGCRTADMRFMFDGKRIAPQNTVTSMEMEDGDVIDVHTEMVGGAQIK